jgi:hypothetical protein
MPCWWKLEAKKRIHQWSSLVGFKFPFGQIFKINGIPLPFKTINQAGLFLDLIGSLGTIIKMGF